jgi:hypothetical protein
MTIKQYKEYSIQQLTSSTRQMQTLALLSRDLPKKGLVPDVPIVPASLP